MIWHIITLFPEMFSGPFDSSIIKRARDKGLVDVKFYNLRGWAVDKRGTVDGKIYGGGAGMVLRIEPLVDALNFVKKSIPPSHISHVALITPSRKTFSQTKARELVKFDDVILICGHYEGFDERIKEFIDEEISIGNYIVTGGELPAMVIVDAVTRLLTGVLTKKEATLNESFSEEGLLEEPQYTKPEDYRGLKVPEILLSGHHGAIKQWRHDHQKHV